MTTDQVTLIDDMLEDFGKGNLPAVLKRFHPAFVLNPPEGVPYAGRRVGVEAFERWLIELGSLLELDKSDHEVLDGGEKAVLLMQITFTSRATGRSTAMRVVEVYAFKDGLIGSIDVFYKDPKAVDDLFDR